MDNTWILVANASMAILYSFVPTESPKKKLTLNIVGEYQHPASREHDHTLVSDRLGEYQKQRGYGHGSFAEPTDPHEYEREVFAKQLFHKLEEGRVANQYKGLILVSSPHFLGLLHQNIDNHPIKHLLIREVQKDYTKEDTKSLIKLLNLEE